MADRGPTAHLPALPHEPPPAAGHPGGRGLWLILQLADEVRVERFGAGTRLALRRRVPRVPAPWPASAAERPQAGPRPARSRRRTRRRALISSAPVAPSYRARRAAQPARAHRRAQPGLPRLLRTAQGPGHHDRAGHQRRLRLHQHAGQALRRSPPDRIAVCFDLGRPAYRIDVYPEYKANRREHAQRLLLADAVAARGARRAPASPSSNGRLRGRRPDRHPGGPGRGGGAPGADRHRRPGQPAAHRGRRRRQGHDQPARHHRHHRLRRGRRHRALQGPARPLRRPGLPAGRPVRQPARRPRGGRQVRPPAGPPTPPPRTLSPTPTSRRAS